MNRFSILIIAVLSGSFLTADLMAQNSPSAGNTWRHISVILDVSGSMNEKSCFTSVKEYLNKDVFRNQLKTGDRFSLILFGVTAREAFSQEIRTESDIDRLSEKIELLKAGDDFTDIGAAMEYLFTFLSARETAPGRDIILFITDGKNTPPPASPYYGKNIAMDERFRDIGQKISRNGWFLYVIGIGNDTDADKVAEAVKGSVLRTTDESLSGVQISEYTARIDNIIKETETAEIIHSTTDLKAVNNSVKSTGQTDSSGAKGFLQGVFPSMEQPSIIMIESILFLLLIVAAVLIIVSIRLFRKIEVIITDNIMGLKTITRTFPVGARIVLNSDRYTIPSIGEDRKGILQIERGIFGLRIRINDEIDIAANSVFHKKGVFRFTGGKIPLSNGNEITIGFT